MFNDYFLRINGVVYPNFYIVQSSYSAPSDPIVLGEYFDANYEKHIEFAPADNMSIHFTIRMLFAEEYVQAVAPIGTDEMTVEYYDLKSDSYKTGIFVCQDNLDPVLFRSRNGKLIYSEKEITLTKKRDVE